MDEIKKTELPRLCVTCDCWHLDGATQECRRRAPTRNLQCTECCFPPRNPMCWCGEWAMARPYEIKSRKEQLTLTKGKLCI